jgi:1-deoxyxylulose-5-phosphate synthase
MIYAPLGRSGLRISRIGLGMMSFGDPGDQPWALTEEQAEPIIRRAVDAGVTFFDTADVYSAGVSEEITGRVLRKLFARRDEYVLATKVYYPAGDGANDRGLSREHVLTGIDASLRRLGVDHVDLYQIHRWDPATPIEETLGALHDIVRAGKARYLGASTMAAWQFAKAEHTARRIGATGFTSMQNRYNLVNREDERELIPLCLDEGVGLLPYSPLARGLLVGKRSAAGPRTARSTQDQREYRRSDLDVAGVVRAIAGQRGIAPATVALAWLLSRPGVTAPIVGATRPGHVDDAIAAIGTELSGDEVQRLQAPYAPHLPGEFT